MPLALAIIGLITVILPLIPPIIQLIEEKAQEAKANGSITGISGPEKLQEAITFLQGIWPAISATGTGAKVAAILTPEQIVQTFTTLINETVRILNAVGIFQKSSPTSPKPA